MIPRLEIAGLSKSFGGIRALQEVSFAIQPGEIHALLGENGAGKSTLVKLVTGLLVPDAGRILLDGAECRFATPMEARACGIVAMYQDPKLFPHLDVAENIFMGLHPRFRWGGVDRARMYAEAERLLGLLEADISPATPVAGLSIGEIQFVEFARAMAAGVDRLLILDEPTASLTPGETARLFRTVRALRARGISIVFISHRLEELQGLVDSVTVLRDGRHVATRPAAELDEAAVVRLMVGRSPEQLYPDASPTATPASTGTAPARLQVERLSLAGVFDDVSFELRAGEVVAMAGLVGAGRSEIAQAIFGATPPSAGRVRIDGQDVRRFGPRAMLAKGLAYLPEDRDGAGLVTTQSIARNVAMAVLRRLARFGVLDRRREQALAAATMQRLQIKASSPAQIVASLSGGNRQKVVLGKSLALAPRVLILDEPTHGIDIGTKAQVHGMIRHLAAEGIAILVISSDLPEVLRLGDRVLVIADGRLTAEFTREEASEEAIMRAASLRRREAA
ncbi:MAG TPA: sugar ABC transporter ATP-binding protein [Acetobacteraceae bacterium]|nr:sugar ABC transporter ATP-binding protein [Acetobacteraceae bacterium]